MPSGLWLRGWGLAPCGLHRVKREGDCGATARRVFVG